MKRRKFYHFSLSVPYLVLIVSGAFTYLLNGFDFFSDSPNAVPGFLAGVLMFFTMSGIIWGPLYTWMVVVMLIWGRGRSTEDVRRLYMLSPVLLACSMGVPVLAVDPSASSQFLLEGILRMNNLGFAVPVLLRDAPRDSAYIGMAWLFMAAICIVVGYVFVGIMVWVERSLIKRGRFKDELETPTANPL